MYTSIQSYSFTKVVLHVYITMVTYLDWCQCNDFSSTSLYNLIANNVSLIEVSNRLTVFMLVLKFCILQLLLLAVKSH